MELQGEIICKKGLGQKYTACASYMVTRKIGPLIQSPHTFHIPAQTCPPRRSSARTFPSLPANPSYCAPHRADFHQYRLERWCDTLSQYVRNCLRLVATLFSKSDTCVRFVAVRYFLEQFLNRSLWDLALPESIKNATPCQGGIVS